MSVYGIAAFCVETAIRRAVSPHDVQYKMVGKMPLYATVIIFYAMAILSSYIKQTFPLLLFVFSDFVFS